MIIRRTYIPAAGCDWLLPTYDLWVKLLGAEPVRSALLEQMALAPDQRVLDVGCGTGSLVVLLKQLHPGVSVVGLDPDPRALARAARKARRAGVNVCFVRGFSDQLPYADASFDRVSCTFMFSLLPSAEKEATLREVRRVLGLGGSFHLLDLIKTPPGSFLLRLLQPSQRFHVYMEEQIVALMHQTGFSDARKTGDYAMWLWPLATYQALHS
jgi:ubiquinone/menaquinone biosynthesis C-methylase UbiE